LNQAMLDPDVPQRRIGGSEIFNNGRQFTLRPMEWQSVFRG